MAIGNWWSVVALSKRFVFISFLIFASACSQSSGPETFPATGVVTLDGQPVDGALIVFTPAEKTEATQLASQAETDADGNFALETYVSGDSYKAGVVPGEYRVTVTKLEVVQDMRSKPKNLLPKKYSLPGTTDLEATVQATETNAFEFELE